VLVVDDDDAFAEIVTLLVSRETDLEMIGRARNGREGVELVQRLDPDVVVMDVEMPELNGLDATQAIRQAGARAQVVMVTGSDVEAHAERAHVVGAIAYLTKSRLTDDLVAAVRAAART
jgi:DNA-binding NarL/FixJ family response regulator